MAKEGRATPTAKTTDGSPATPEALLLVARVGGKETARLLLEHGTAFIGSDPGNDLVVDEATVSRRHLEAQLRRGGVWVRDSGSTNDTRYQGARVSELLVPVGGVLRLGKKATETELRKQRLVPRPGHNPSVSRAAEPWPFAARAWVQESPEGSTQTPGASEIQSQPRPSGIRRENIVFGVMPDADLREDAGGTAAAASPRIGRNDEGDDDDSGSGGSFDGTGTAGARRGTPQEGRLARAAREAGAEGDRAPSRRAAVTLSGR